MEKCCPAEWTRCSGKPNAHTDEDGDHPRRGALVFAQETDHHHADGYENAQDDKARDKDPPVHIIQKRIVPARHVHKLRNFQEKPEMRTEQNQRGKADPEIAQKRALCFYKAVDKAVEDGRNGEHAQQRNLVPEPVAGEHLRRSSMEPPVHRIKPTSMTMTGPYDPVLLCRQEREQ